MAKHYIKKNKTYLLSKILIVFFIVVMIISCIEIIKWYLNNKKNEHVQEELSKSIIINDNAEDEEERITIDFDELKEKNRDTVGWIKVNGTNAEYVVVQTNNNDYYLNHNFYKEYNKAGWIFADYRNNFDGYDKNIVIYGHNRKNDSMFGSLTNILEENWYNNEENYNVIFITEYEKLTYQVFSVYQIEDEDYYIQTNFKDDLEFKNFINTLKNRSIKNFNVDITPEDSILTLSTCANNNKYRVVLHAKKIIE